MEPYSRNTVMQDLKYMDMEAEEHMFYKDSKMILQYSDKVVIALVKA